MTAPREFTHEERKAWATRLFGPDPLEWNFVCPVCKHVQSVDDYKEAGAPDGAGAVVAMNWLREIPDTREAYEAAARGCLEIAEEWRRQGYPDSEEAAARAAVLLERVALRLPPAAEPDPDTRDLFEEPSAS